MSQAKKNMNFFALFRYSDRRNKIILCTAIFVAICNGILNSYFPFILGDGINSYSSSKKEEEIIENINQVCLRMFYFGIVNLIAAFLRTSLIKYVGQNIIQNIKSAYFEALIRQELGWFDKINPSSLTENFENNCNNISRGIEEKFTYVIMAVSYVIGSCLFSFTQAWKLSLIILSITPLVIISALLFSSIREKIDSVTIKAYAEAGTMVIQALRYLKTVKAFGGEEKEIKKFEKTLHKAENYIRKFGIIEGLAFGFYDLVYYIGLGIGFYFGTNFVSVDPNYSAGQVISITLAILFSFSTLGISAPALKFFTLAKNSAKTLYEIIEREALIDTQDPNGLKPEKIEGRISFHNVSFSYPSNRARLVLDNISFDIEANKTTAIVGESGSGKSTCVQLIDRFYDPQAGQIKLDDVDIKDLNLEWLRKNISYVGQEPVLFSTTIRQNLLLANPNACEEELIQALKLANAYEFVMQLPDLLDTYIGLNGAQLSGGQKQRIAIARAILRNTQIMLFDESTSALDSKNEKEIQETLNKLGNKKTCIIIAHRLSTIRNADMIHLINEGKLIDSGDFDYLLKNNQSFRSYFKTKSEEKSDQDEIEANEEKEEGKKLKNDDSQEKLILEESLIINNEKQAVSFKTQSSEKLRIIRDFYHEGKSESAYIFLSILFAILLGLPSPLSSIFLAKVLSSLLEESQSGYDEAKTNAVYYFYIGAASFFAYTFQIYLFTYTSQRLLKKIRTKLFSVFLDMKIAFHDEKRNHYSNLSEILASHCENIAQFYCTAFGVLVQSSTTVICAIGICLNYSWQLTLLNLGLLPILFFVSVKAATVSIQSKAEEKYVLEGKNVLSECINNIKTVVYLGSEKQFHRSFISNFSKIRNLRMKQGFKLSLALAFYSLLIDIRSIFPFLSGTALYLQGTISLETLFIGTYTLAFAMDEVGKSFLLMPEMGKAISSAKIVLEYLKINDSNRDDLHSANDENKGYPHKINQILPFIESRLKISSDLCVEFKNVSFRYPSKKNFVFQNLSFTVQTGKKTAIVGPSGCGKSTIFQLLLRFYDINQGEILIDGKNIKTLQAKQLRACMSIVSQEPNLFYGSIDDNIKYGYENATHEELLKAKECANILSLESKLNSSQETNSIKQDQLSGGQKQRVAIARAVIRNPQIFLFDEATSALDVQNEEFIQNNLDAFAKERTSLIIAHRMSTIMNADDILVFNEGKILERGNYDELVKNKNFFYRMIQHDKKQ